MWHYAIVGKPDHIVTQCEQQKEEAKRYETTTTKQHEGVTWGATPCCCGMHAQSNSAVSRPRLLFMVSLSLSLFPLIHLKAKYTFRICWHGLKGWWWQCNLQEHTTQEAKFWLWDIELLNPLRVEHDCSTWMLIQIELRPMQCNETVLTVKPASQCQIECVCVCVFNLCGQGWKWEEVYDDSKKLLASKQMIAFTVVRLKRNEGMGNVFFEKRSPNYGSVGVAATYCFNEASYEAVQIG